MTSRYKAKQSPVGRKYRDYSSGEDEDESAFGGVGQLEAGQTTLQSRSQSVRRVDLQDVADGAEGGAALGLGLGMGGPNARFAARGAVVHSTGCKNFLVVCGVVALVVLALVTEAVEALESLLVLSLCLGALAFALIQALKLLDKDTRTQRMQEVARFIRRARTKI